MLDRLQIFIIAFGLLFFVGSAQASDLKLSETDWHKTFEKAGTYVDNTKNECAKFVNRLFALRFGTTIWGNAWDIPLNNSNQKFLKLKWTFDDAVIDPKTNWVRTTAERVFQFENLYQAIENSETGFGLAGFSYRFSFAYQNIGDDDLQQTHIAFISPKKIFELKNNSDESKTVQELFEEKIGEIHIFERDFVNQRLNKYKNLTEKFTFLSDTVLPNKSVWYYDFPLEEQFKETRSENILISFLRKHRNNKVSALLRPVSWTDILPTAWK